MRVLTSFCTCALGFMLPCCQNERVHLHTTSPLRPDDRRESVEESIRMIAATLGPLRDQPTDWGIPIRQLVEQGLVAFERVSLDGRGLAFETSWGPIPLRRGDNYGAIGVRRNVIWLSPKHAVEGESCVYTEDAQIRWMTLDVLNERNDEFENHIDQMWSKLEG